MKDGGGKGLNRETTSVVSEGGKPDYTGIGIVEPVSEISRGLFQGMRPATYVGYDLVVNCEEHLTSKPRQGWSGMLIHLPMRDEDGFVVPMSAVEAAAEAAARVLRSGGVVLVHCTGGLNRSSLVTVEVLRRRLGMTPREAVAHIRAERDEFCLCNRAFERLALREPLPTAETSAFRTDATTGGSAASEVRS